MKTFRLVRNCAMTLVVAMALTGCSDDDEPEIYDDLVVSFDSSAISYNADGYWSDCYNVGATGLSVDGLFFSHVASVTSYEWDGEIYSYSVWCGFCPSKSTDTADYSLDDWTLHQWNSITGGGVSGSSDPYLVGFWDVSEESDPAEPALSITYGGKQFRPKEIYVTNNTYGYYSLKNGTAYNTAFAAGDYFTLRVYGSLNGSTVSYVDVSLAEGADILSSWERVDLSALGTVDMIYFQMISSDTGIWGMNNPAYFCLGRLTIGLD